LIHELIHEEMLVRRPVERCSAWLIYRTSKLNIAVSVLSTGSDQLCLRSVAPAGAAAAIGHLPSAPSAICHRRIILLF
jgi:hypothetical protein